MTDLAKKFGTPLYLLFEEEIVKSCQTFTKSVYKNFGSNSMILYASKALSCIRLYKIINKEKLGLDVSSGGEIFTAIKANFPSNKITFHGNNKSNDELKMAIENQVSRIVVDNEDELENLIYLSDKYKKIINVLFRVKPGINANTHKSIKTGSIDSKFGMEFDQVKENIKKILNNKFISFKGIHCHIGSQIFEYKNFQDSSCKMIKFCYEIKNQIGIETEELNLGGGFPVKYLDSDKSFDIPKCIDIIGKSIKDECNNLNLKIPFIYFEPGRSIIAKAGITLYTIGCVKKTNKHTYVIVDGSMNDNPRFALYGAKYKIENITKRNDNLNFEKVTVSGRCCESGDIISDECYIKSPQKGDILAVYCTGAYNFSMASNYNKFVRPPIVLVSKNGTAKLIVRRQSFEDLISCELI